MITDNVRHHTRRPARDTMTTYVSAFRRMQLSGRRLREIDLTLFAGIMYRGMDSKFYLGSGLRLNKAL